MDGKAVERTGLVPRSIIRTFNRFLQQLEPDAKAQAVQEFRISRYQVLVSVKSLIILFIVPIIVNISSKAFFFEPLVRYIWNSKQHDIFLNSYQENRAFLEMEDFSERMFFESLIQNEEESTPLLNDYSPSKFFKKFKNWISEYIQYVIKKSTNESNTSFSFFSWLKQQSKPMSTSSNKNFAELSSFAGTSQDIFPCVPLRSVEDSGKMEGATNEKRAVEQKNMQNSPCFTSMASLNGEDVQSSSLNDPFRNPTSSSLRFASTSPMSKEDLGLLEMQPKGSFHNGLPSNKIYKDDSKKKEYPLEEGTIDLDFQREVLQIVNFYNNESIQSICNILGESLTLLTIAFLLSSMKTQMIILKSFLTESFYSLNDTIKSFLIILITDLLVGFHSPRGWEISLETILKHFGLPENQDFIFLFVATFPVFLDTIFKYWVFRYLNKISPSTVATYHNMIE